MTAKTYEKVFCALAAAVPDGVEIETMATSTAVCLGHVKGPLYAKVTSHPKATLTEIDWYTYDDANLRR